MLILSTMLVSGLISTDNVMYHKFDINGTSLEDSTGNQWRGNYWGGNKTQPKLIFGELVLIQPPAHGPGYGLIIPWVNIDWRPAKEPYDINKPQSYGI